MHLRRLLSLSSSRGPAERGLGVAYGGVFRSLSTAVLGPLQGVRVLDVSRVLAGPYCTMVLGDMGADVLKIENPAGGDDTRTWGPPFRGGESAYFMSCNRNKRSVAINLKSPAGVDLIRSLVMKCDVFVENYVPGKLDAMGLGYKALSELNPRLVYASISGFGPTGPYAQRVGYDLLVSAVGGLVGITGPEGGEPVKVGVAITDVVTGLFAHGAILAALYARHTSGRGQHIETSLLEAQVAALVNIGSSYLIGGKEAERRGTSHESIVPYQGFKTADGHLIVAVGNNGQFERLCGLMGVPELARDSRFLNNKDRVANRADLVKLLQARFATKRTAEWVEILPWTELPVGPINNMNQVFTDPQVLHRNMVQEVDHPTAGRIKLAGIPVKYSETSPSVRLPPPLLGQHTRQVLQEVLGLGMAEVEALERSGVVRQGEEKITSAF